MSAPLIFTCQGGSLLYRSTTPLTEADIKWLRGMYRDEAEAAHKCADVIGFRRATALLGECVAAHNAYRAWVNASEVT